MDRLLEDLDRKLREWDHGTSEFVQRRLAELIELADAGALDHVRSRLAEPEVLDLMDRDIGAH